MFVVGELTLPGDRPRCEPMRNAIPCLFDATAWISNYK